MRTVTTEAALCVADEGVGLECKLAKVTYLVREDDTFCYTVEPCYAVTDLLRPPLFQGIPGLNLDLRLARYVRENRTPVLISERAPAPNREDLQELLTGVGMTYLDPLEWLIRTDLRYSGDRMYLRRWEPADEPRELQLGDLIEKGARTDAAALAALGALYQGHALAGDGWHVGGGGPERATAYRLLRELCLRAGVRGDARGKGILRSPAGRGRRRTAAGGLDLLAAVAAYEAHELSAEEAAGRLGVGTATFYRRLREVRAERRAGGERTAG